MADFKLLENFERMTHADAVHEKVMMKQHVYAMCLRASYQQASLLELPGIDPDEDTRYSCKFEVLAENSADIFYPLL